MSAFPEDTLEVDLERVSRVEVIDANGRAFLEYLPIPTAGVRLALQDDQRTLKVFLL